MRKLLVANRSEIAIRCFRAATELGLRTVAIYSHEDRFSVHRFKADEAFLIGPPEGGEPVKSYLNIAAIVDVAKQHGVDAIHPGYGFLSENAAFARACGAAGIQFVGPTPEQLDMFGDKTAAKRLAQTAQVPIIPGSERALEDPDEVAREAERIGYPLMIKASFGGGGRGMRIVRTPDELRLLSGPVDAMISSALRAARRAGLSKLGVHALRHTFCSHLSMRGAPVNSIRDLAGHGELSVTQRYMHLSPSALEAAIRLLEAPSRGCIGEAEAGQPGNAQS
jgi:pyruvate carboxylase